MKYRVIAYFDTDIDKFNPPMMIPMPLEDCVESLRDSAKKGQIPGSEKFQAFDLGAFDTADGKFTLNEKPVMVADLTNYGK